MNDPLSKTSKIIIDRFLNFLQFHTRIKYECDSIDPKKLVRGSI